MAGKMGGARPGAGRPRKEINQIEFEKLCALHCTRSEICAWFDVTDKTLINWCKETYNGADFSTVFKEKSEKGKISLRRMQWQLAEKNTAMAIFLGKNILGQTDKMEETIKDGNKDKVWNINFITGAEKDGH